MARDRFELARSQYFKALMRLHEAVEADESPMIRDALIQRFEFTYELAWKSMFWTGISALYMKVVKTTTTANGIGVTAKTSRPSASRPSNPNQR